MAERQHLDIVLLQTKLNRPGVTRNLVARPRLTKLLDSGMEGPLTLVVAPAGFGKTTLVSSWLQERSNTSDAPIPAAWLSLDEGDREQDLLPRYFIGALRTIFPDACPETLNLLNTRDEVPAGLLSDMLINELELLPSRFIIVLDDFYTLHDQSVLEFLNDFAQHWPRHMHMVILSRHNPPLPLASLRAKGLLTEIRARELRFSSDETSQYFDHVFASTPDEGALSLLQQQLEGWIAGLKMITLSMGDRYAPRALISALREGDVYITDYLLDEVIHAQPPAIQRFLLTTSIADRFCASLCEALMDGSDVECDVRACLDYIDAAELFVIPLDTHRQWYRFHRMFRDLLRHRLWIAMGTEQIKLLHGRAADWYAAQNMPEQAIHHALEGGNLEQAARFMTQGLRDILNSEEWPTLERWLHLMPESFIQTSPDLLIIRAWIHGNKYEYDKLGPLITQLEALPDGDDQSPRMLAIRGQAAVLKGHYHYYFNRYDQAVTECRKGLDLMPEEWRYVRSIAGLYLGLSLYSTGRADSAEAYLAERYESFSRSKIDSISLRFLMGQTIKSVYAGAYETVERTAQVLLRQGTQARISLFQGWGYYFLGLVNYEWNAVETARRHFTDGGDAVFGLNPLVARNAMIGQALASQASGDSTAALETLDQLSRLDVQRHGREDADATSARARVMLMQGNLEAAGRWADLFVAPLAEQSLAIQMERPHLTKARILIARDMGADVQTVVSILDTVGEIAERTLNVRVTIEILALRALAQLTQGDSGAARATLIRAAELARYGPFTRTFVDLGPQMQKLLYQIAGHEPTKNTVSRILAAFQGSDAPGATVNHKVGRPAGFQIDADDGPIESLTPREREVMALMAEPISLKVIAARMNISYATARRYTISIYNKFGVHSRWEAVDSAVQHGIISPR